MALTFRTVTRKILAGKEAGKIKVFAMPKSKGLMPLKEVCELVSSRSSFSASDVRGILEGLSWSVGFLLRTGHSVQLGDLGCFRISITSQGIGTDEKFDASLVRRPRIIFTPGEILRETLRNMEFVPAETITVEVEKECEEEHMP